MSQSMQRKEYVRIELSRGGSVEVELYPDLAPITVTNFLSLVERGFYNGLTFHRIVPGFVIQGGDPTGTGMGGSGERIRGEFAANGVANELSHTRGVISMARSQHPDSASSQFFLMVADATYLDGNYAGFGRVISGQELLDELVRAYEDGSDPVPSMKSITRIEK